MNSSKCKLFVSLLLLGGAIGTRAIVLGSDKEPLSRVSAALSAKTCTIRVGQPLVCTLTYMYETDSNAPPNEVLHRARVDIVDSNDHPIVKRYPVFPSLLFRGRVEGQLVYSGDFTLFFNFRTKKGLIFDRPGRYRITLSHEGPLGSDVLKPLMITVHPASPLELQALESLSDPNDYIFLEFGEHEYPERRLQRMANLGRVADKHPDSLLGKWCASRLGVEYFKDFQEEHPSFEKFKAKYREGKTEEPLFDRAAKYLGMGTGLPDEFALRENVLYSLSRAEFVKGDYERAASLLDELGAKYPYGEYGKRATRAKAELLSISKQEEGRIVAGTRRLPLLGILVVVCVVVVILGFLLRSRLSSRNK